MRFKKSNKAVMEVKAAILSIALLLSIFVVIMPPLLHAQTVTSQKLDSLVKKLQDPDKEVRLQAVEGLMKLADTIAVPPLIGALKDSDQEVRTKAAEALGRLADERMVPPLIEALKDPDKGVRTAAARTLGGQYDKRAVPPLIEALKDPDKGVRSAAAHALAHLKDKRAVPPLIEALKDPDKGVRSAAAHALAYLKDKRAVPPLIEDLKDPDKWVRSAAARTLGDLKDKRAVPPLIEALKDSHDDVRHAAARSLGRLGDKAAVEPLILVLKNDPHRGTRCEALMALRNLGYETPADLRWVCQLGPPPPPPPLDLKGGGKIVAFWNTWFENRDEKTRVEVLKKDATYSFVLDISKYAYFSDSSAEPAPSIMEAVEKVRKESSTIRFRIRPILYGDFLRFTDNQRAWKELKVDINKLVLADKAVEDNIRKEKDKLSSGEIKVHNFAHEMQAGEVRFDLLAERSGDATILITIWDEKGMIPLDHLTLSVRVIDEGTPAARQRPLSETVPLRKGRQTLLNISSDFSSSGALLADAAFYVFEKSPNGKSIVLFAAKAGDAATGAQDEVSVYAWETESLLSEYVEKKDQLIIQIRNAREQAKSIAENVWKYSYESAAEGLKKKIFGGRSDKDRKQAADAEKVFRDLVQKKTQKSIVFVRMRNEDGHPVYLPLGILAASSKNQFLDKRIILVQPLPREHYPAGDHPVGSWTFNVPENMAELSTLSNTALSQLEKKPPYYRDISTVKGFFKETVASASSEGVLLLAHQAGGNLWFTNQAIGIVSEDIKRPFPAGSVAILSACSTASSEGNNQAILEKLNANGIDAMIISPFPVHADYGAMLAIKFIRAIEAAKKDSKALSLAELFSMATKETASYFKDVRSLHFDDMDLEFLIAGDYRVKIAPK